MSSAADVRDDRAGGVDPRFFIFSLPFVAVYGWALWLGFGHGQCDTSGIFAERKFAVLCVWAVSAAVFHHHKLGSWSWPHMATGAFAGGLAFGLITVVLSLLSSQPFVSPASVSLLFYAGIAGLFTSLAASHRSAVLLGLALLLGQVAVDLGAHLPWSCIY